MTGGIRRSASSGEAAESTPISSSNIEADVSTSTANNSLQLTAQKLNGKNYLEWAQTVKLVIDGKEKLGHLTGE